MANYANNNYSHLTPKQQYFAIKLSKMSPAGRVQYCGTVLNNPATPARNKRDLKVVMEGNKHWFAPRDSFDRRRAEKKVRQEIYVSNGFRWRP